MNERNIGNRIKATGRAAAIIGDAALGAFSMEVGNVFWERQNLELGIQLKLLGLMLYSTPFVLIGVDLLREKIGNADDLVK